MPTKKSLVTSAAKTLAKKVAGKKVATTAAKKNTKTKKPVAKKKAPAKKAAPKKVTTKKSVSKAAAKPKKAPAMKKPSKDLVFASDQESFWVQDGEILNSLIALRDALDDMSKDVYTFHATGDNNDFSIWVETVLCDGDCAADLQKAKTQKAAKTVVVKHLKLYVI